MQTEEGQSDILRFATAGSVDDGKSSLIGRLLYDSKAILEDQLRAIEHASRQRGSDQVELALLTDGLRAEREQNITIDVAYRFFTTPKRKFIIADTPGHVQYTRNMVTGTSTADLSVILIDARKGVLTQSKRHAAISALLGLPHLVVAVNKMDLVGYAADVFGEIEREFRAFVERLGVPQVTFIPISALLGDNVVDASERMPWYSGPTLLDFLENVRIPNRAKTALRLPIQYVVRPHQDFRGFAGRVEGGSVQIGDLVAVAGSGRKARVTSIFVLGEAATEAKTGDPALITLDQEIDISRGDMLVSTTDTPQSADRVEAILCWLQEAPLAVGKRYTLMHTTRKVNAVVPEVLYRVDADTLESLPSSALGMNDIGRVVVQTSSPLNFDGYEENPVTGSFVLIDPATNVTVAAGLLRKAAVAEADTVRRRVGRVVWLGRWSEAGESIASRLRVFGRPVVLLRSSDVPDVRVLAGQIADQGFDVLIAGALPGGTASDLRADDLVGEVDSLDPLLEALDKV